MKMMSQQPDADPGDDSAILRVHARYVSDVTLVLSQPSGTPTTGTVLRQTDGRWELVFSVDRGKDRRQRHFVAIDPDGTRSDRWLLVQLGAGVWDLAPSLHVPGQIHAFLTLVGVPEPAPWVAR